MGDQNDQALPGAGNGCRKAGDACSTSGGASLRHAAPFVAWGALAAGMILFVGCKAHDKYTFLHGNDVNHYEHVAHQASYPQAVLSDGQLLDTAAPRTI
jgi:hypothetical protein